MGLLVVGPNRIDKFFTLQGKSPTDGAGGLARLAAEGSWLKFGLDHGVFVHVFRLEGSMVLDKGTSAFSPDFVMTLIE